MQIKQHLYRKRQSKKTADVSSQLRKASGIKEISTKRPQGFEAIVAFDFGDIFIDDALFSLLNDEVSKEVDECLRRIIQGDYGQISVDDIQDNNESRYFGNGEITAVFRISLGNIKICKGTAGTDIELITV